MQGEIGLHLPLQQPVLKKSSSAIPGLQISKNLNMQKRQ